MMSLAMKVVWFEAQNWDGDFFAPASAMRIGKSKDQLAGLMDNLFSQFSSQIVDQFSVRYALEVDHCEVKEADLSLL
jgi:hypothetical protein